MKVGQTLLALALPLVIGTAHANLVNNGSFESGAFAPPSNQTQFLATGSGPLSDWVVSGQQIAWIGNGNPWQGLAAQDATHFLDLTAYSNTSPWGAVTQSIPTTTGDSYSLSFYFGTSTYWGVPASMTVTAGATNMVFTTSAVGNNDWKHYTLPFVGAAGPATIISFLGGPTGTTNYIGLDNVSVIAVPEPSDAMMLLAGLGVIGAIVVRRNKSKKQG